MKIVASVPLLLAALVGRAESAGEGQWFSYFEHGGLGPNNWDLLATADNQCGGSIRTAPFVSYGQSPVAIDGGTDSECDATWDYVFTPGDCTFSDLEFTLSNNGVKVAPASGKTCSFGKMQIPHFPKAEIDPQKDGEGNLKLSDRPTFYAAQFHIHTSSEHTIGGKGSGGYFPAELHVVHLIEGQKEHPGPFPATVWGSMIQGGGTDHPIFEEFLRGWEKAAGKKEADCKENPEGSRRRRDRKLNIDRRRLADSFTPVVEDPIARTCYAAKPGYTNWTVQDFQTPGHAPNLYGQMIRDPSAADNVYGAVYEGYGSFTYKGGLTTPACTQAVNWNLMDEYIVLSDAQLDRLRRLIWCYVDSGNCQHATAASVEGSTSRPPQAMAGRVVRHRCRADKCSAEGAECEAHVDTAPAPGAPGYDYRKPVPVPEDPNTSEGQCNKAWTENCPEDKRANPNVSPNLKANAPVWSDFEGFWVGDYKAVDRTGEPLRENFVNPNVSIVIPYDRSVVKMLVNRTIRETRYYEHITFVYQPADSTPRTGPEANVQFCKLPLYTGTRNVLGQGVCGKHGWIGYAERFGAATHEKDGIAELYATTGRFADAQEGSAVPVADKSIYVSMRGEEAMITETFTFTNENRTMIGGSGQVYLFKQFEPYVSDPHAETFTYNLRQVDEEQFKRAFKDMRRDASVYVSEWKELPDPSEDGRGSCLNTTCDLSAANKVDALSSPNPYSQDGKASAWFIAVIVILGVIILLLVLYYLHLRQIAKQKNRISRQFARRVAETIKVDGSHTQLSAEALEEEFKRIDTDHSGYLSKSELKAFVNSGKIGTMSDADFNALFAALDVDGNGTVDFTEFCAFMAQCGQVYDEEESKLTPEQRRQSVARKLSGSLKAKDNDPKDNDPEDKDPEA